MVSIEGRRPSGLSSVTTAALTGSPSRRDGTAATLFVRCDPALALQLSYEADRMRERLNGYFGYPAVGAIRIVQRRQTQHVNVFFC